MPERTAHTETLRAGTPVAIGSVILLPVERVVMHSDKGNTSVWFSVAKEPYALIVRDPDGLHAFDANAAGLSLDLLCEKIPGLDTMLASMRSSHGAGGSATENN